jgi:hypothetical protein
VGALKRYRQLGGGDEFYKFGEVGQCLEGIWRGTVKGKFGDNGVIETPDGIRHVFTLSATLKDLLQVPDGTGVKVTYQGMALSKAGNQYHKFQTLVEADEGSEEVPF